MTTYIAWVTRIRHGVEVRNVFNRHGFVVQGGFDLPKNSPIRIILVEDDCWIPQLVRIKLSIRIKDSW